MSHRSPAIESASPASSRRTFWLRTGALTAVLLPAAYAGFLFDVLVHEAVGHGGTALILGGSFKGMVIQWDGMGWAWANAAPGAPVWHELAILAGGVASSAFVGIILLIAAASLRRRLILCTILLLFALNCVLSSQSYLLWNSYHPVPPGDFGRIHVYLDSPPLRYFSMIVGATVLLAATLGGAAFYFDRCLLWIGQGRPVMGQPRVILVLLLIIVPGCVGWFLFDWDQIAPGIGSLPQYAGAASVCVAGLLAYHSPRVGRIVPCTGVVPSTTYEQ